MEKLLMEQNRLREQKRLQDESLTLKDREIQTLQRMLPNIKVKPCYLLHESDKRKEMSTNAPSNIHIHEKPPRGSSPPF